MSHILGCNHSVSAPQWKYLHPIPTPFICLVLKFKYSLTIMFNVHSHPLIFFFFLSIVWYRLLNSLLLLLTNALQSSLSHFVHQVPGLEKDKHSKGLWFCMCLSVVLICKLWISFRRKLFGMGGLWGAVANCTFYFFWFLLLFFSRSEFKKKLIHWAMCNKIIYRQNACFLSVIWLFYQFKSKICVSIKLSCMPLWTSNKIRN